MNRKHIVSAYLTFVALDNHGKPTAVPPVIPPTELEKRRFEEADLRRSNRISHKQTLRKRQSQ